MLFTINGLKYNTEKMRKMANVKKWYPSDCIINRMLRPGERLGNIYVCELWKSKKGNWLLTHKDDYGAKRGEAIEEEEAKKLLMNYDISAYEALYGEIEEA